MQLHNNFDIFKNIIIRSDYYDSESRFRNFLKNTRRRLLNSHLLWDEIICASLSSFLSIFLPIFQKFILNEILVSNLLIYYIPTTYIFQRNLWFQILRKLITRTYLFFYSLFNMLAWAGHNFFFMYVVKCYMKHIFFKNHMNNLNTIWNK